MPKHRCAELILSSADELQVHVNADADAETAKDESGAEDIRVSDSRFCILRKLAHTDIRKCVCACLQGLTCYHAGLLFLFKTASMRVRQAAVQSIKVRASGLQWQHAPDIPTLTCTAC